MKMIYQPKVSVSSKRRGRLYAFFGFLVVGLFVVLVIPSSRSFIEGGVRTLVFPLFKVESAVVQSLPTLSFKSRNELLAENQKLLNDLSEARAAILNEQSIVLENENLKEMLGRKKEGEELLLASVLSRPNRSPYDTVLIDLGLTRSIAAGSLVYAYGHIPIGKIVEVNRVTSLVRLFSSPGEETSVLIGDKHISATAYGVGSGNFRVLLPKDTPVAEGDIITIPGLDNDVIGQVEVIQKSESETLARILFKSPVNIFELSSVFIRVTH